MCLLPVSLHVVDPNILSLIISKTFLSFWSLAQFAQSPRREVLLFCFFVFVSLSGLKLTSFPTTQLPFFQDLTVGTSTIFKGNSTHSHKELLSPMALGLKIIRLIDHMLPRVWIIKSQMRAHVVQQQKLQVALCQAQGSCFSFFLLARDEKVL